MSPREWARAIARRPTRAYTAKVIAFVLADVAVLEDGVWLARTTINTLSQESAAFHRNARRAIANLCARGDLTIVRPPGRGRTCPHDYQLAANHLPIESEET